MDTCSFKKLFGSVSITLLQDDFAAVCNHLHFTTKTFYLSGYVHPSKHSLLLPRPVWLLHSRVVEVER